LPLREYLQHILDEADYLIAQSQDLGASEFLEDETLRRALSEVSRLSAKPPKGSLLPLPKSIPRSNGGAWPVCEIA
jgi:hypothetical protein